LNFSCHRKKNEFVPPYLYIYTFYISSYRLTKGTEAAKHGKAARVGQVGKAAPEAGEGKLSFDAFEAALDRSKAILEAVIIHTHTT
jgi:hypothetical protein